MQKKSYKEAHGINEDVEFDNGRVCDCDEADVKFLACLPYIN